MVLIMCHKMESMPLTMHDGHVIVQVDGRRALIDTGSPKSFGRGDQVSICAKQHPLGTDSVMTIEDVSDYVGCKLDMLLGMDLMSHYDVRISRRESLVELHQKSKQLGAVTEMGAHAGVPTLSIGVNGTSHTVFFDTGAPVSYLKASFLRNFRRIGSRRDFFQKIGRFDVAMRSVNVTLAGKTLTLPFGEMEGELVAMLNLVDAQGILGTDILEVADVVLSTRCRSLIFIWHSQVQTTLRCSSSEETV